MRTRELHQVANFAGRDVQEYIVERGWDDQIANELPRLSLQPHILKTTPRDAAERFKTSEAADRWYDNEKKQPIVYTKRLGGVGVTRSGLIWFSRQVHPDAPGYGYTSGFRLYEGAVGKGLAKPFSHIAHDDFAQQHEGSGVWLETDEDNIPAVKLYDGLGYTTVANHGGRLVMVWRPDSEG